MEWTLERQADGRYLYKLKGDNRVEGAGRITWVEEAELIPVNGKLRTKSWKKRSDGAEQMDWSMVYDWAAGKAKYAFADRAAGKSESKDIALPPGAMPGDEMFFLLRGFPFEKGVGASVEGTFVMTDGMVINGAVVLRGEETLQTAWGPVACYKLELKPKGVVGLVAPDMFLWFSKKAPHVWMRYDGRDNGLTSPRTKNTLLKYEPAESVKP
jgi:hypothetical protein